MAFELLIRVRVRVTSLWSAMTKEFFSFAFDVRHDNNVEFFETSMMK